jgi:hypothetical protein
MARILCVVHAGKKNPWEGVTLVPFIQEEDMLAGTVFASWALPECGVLFFGSCVRTQRPRVELCSLCFFAAISRHCSASLLTPDEVRVFVSSHASYEPTLDVGSL